jgi:hypothetical protein
MTSTLTASSHFNHNNHFTTQQPTQTHKRRVLLKRATLQINDPEVMQQLRKVKKSVRFNSERLEQVRYFYKSQSPVTCKTDPPLMDTSADDFKLSLPDWPTRNSIFYNTEQKIRMENVVLVDGDFEQMSENKVVIEGRCRALNLNFYKSVSIRYTFDLWRTYQETTGEFRESIASTSNTWDRFSFRIPIDADKKTQSLYLALRYTVDDQEFWDNNNGMNYEVIVTPESPIVDYSVACEEEEVVEEEQQPTRTLEDEEELAIMKDNTKVLGRRYDFSASLTAAANRKPYYFSASPPPSPPGTPIDTEENFSYVPPVFFGNSTTIDSPPLTYTATAPVIKKSEPIPIINATQTTPTSAEGFQMSYSDFVNKYCFYNSHSNPIYSTFSTSPSAVLS